MPCRPRMPTPGDADGFSGRRRPGDGRCRLAEGRLRAGHRPGPPSAPIPLSALPSATARRSAMGMSPDGAIGNGKSTAVAAAFARVDRPPYRKRIDPRQAATGQRNALDMAAEAAAPGAPASAPRRMTDNHQALQCREGGRPAPASPRNRFATHEKTLLRCSAASLSSASAPASSQGNAGRHRPPALPRAALHTGATNGGADVCRQDRAQTCVGRRGRWPECRTAGSPHENPGMSDSARQPAARCDRRHGLRSVGGRRDGGAHPGDRRSASLRRPANPGHRSSGKGA